jgi:hypothetical protein
MALPSWLDSIQRSRHSDGECRGRGAAFTASKLGRALQRLQSDVNIYSRLGYNERVMLDTCEPMHGWSQNVDGLEAER